MKPNKKKPFIISRHPHKISSPLSDASSSDAQLDKALVPIDTRIERQNQILATQTVYKNCYSLFKVSPNLLPELLKRYAEDNLKYRDEEYTQQSDHFLSRISASKKIPKDIKAKYPLYMILVSICKIFMLNEYEIVVLACALDHCNWKFEESIYPEEADFLKEFPGNLGNTIDADCKRLIIHLLIITFSLKQYLNEKGEVDKIHAYCESICINFQAIFNRWTRTSYVNKFNYSPVEINRKFKSFSQQEIEDPILGMKDYNTVVDSIMNLTGSYKSKINNQRAITPIHPPIMPISHPTPLFANIPMTPQHNSLLFPDSRMMMSHDLPLPLERSVSRPRLLDLGELDLLPPEMGSVSRQASFSNLLGEDFGRKKVKMNNDNAGLTLPRDNSLFRDFSSFFAGGNLLKGGDFEDFFQVNPLPSLSKKSSSTSQLMLEEQPSLFRFHSNMSSWYKE